MYAQESGRDAIRMEAEVREERRHYAGFDDGGRGHEPRKYRRPLEIEKGNKFPLEPPEEISPGDTLTLA